MQGIFKKKYCIWDTWKMALIALLFLKEIADLIILSITLIP